jgi:hypothetical protein
MKVQALRLQFLVADTGHCGSPSHTLKAQSLQTNPELQCVIPTLQKRAPS